ncbi:alpha/beta hydrolase fold-domain-containing protein [Lasiosphaeria hispida]|uniref:Alpha/beta hydrolase fold-domain-containing protein n=1 Tax=Lasiosphaeria hispida TaxID=260671 RepID=A0AAJ0HEI5_9PEZI|nr:alpha/beta hydrolase fold-domain-containing protein [Lasiosphaeria hispida]
MDKDKQGLIRSLLPKVPLVARVALFHILGLSEQSRYLNLRSEIITAVLRSYMNPSKLISISTSQRLFNQDVEVKGSIWVSRYKCPAPTDRGIQGAIASAIEGLRSSKEDGKLELKMPEVVGVEAEWQGYRAGVKRETRLPDISEKEKYDEMMKEVTTPATILYLHGGAFWLMDPATHRPTTKRLAKLCGGRCYSVRYRLAPQHVFPAALMDALVSYLALLYPPPGAFHDPIPAEHIVFAGDSAGGNLALALIQALLELHRQGATILWQGKQRSVPLPAGTAVSSPWMDITHSSPSCETRANYDYLPPLTAQLAFEPTRPHCAAWPSNPPRTMLYAEDTLVTHPLVSLLLAPSWRGAPPLYICTGWELLADEDKFTTLRFHEDGVPVVYEEYEGMPHCFALLFADMPGGKRCLEGWAGFVRRVVDGEKVQSSFTLIKAKTSDEVEVDPKGLRPYEQQEIRERVERRMRLGWVPEGGAKL